MNEEVYHMFVMRGPGEVIRQAMHPVHPQKRRCVDERVVTRLVSIPMCIGLALMIVSSSASGLFALMIIRVHQACLPS